MITIATAVKLLDITRPTVTKAVNALIDPDVREESPGKKRDRIFSDVSYRDLLKAGAGLDE